MRERERLEPDEATLERRSPPRRHGSRLRACRSTSTRAWSARSISRSSFAPSGQAVTCPSACPKVLKQLSAFAVLGATSKPSFPRPRAAGAAVAAAAAAAATASRRGGQHRAAAAGRLPRDVAERRSTLGSSGLALSPGPPGTGRPVAAMSAPREAQLTRSRGDGLVHSVRAPRRPHAGGLRRRQPRRGPRVRRRGPGFHEDQQGAPFSGQAGELVRAAPRRGRSRARATSIS